MPRTLDTSILPVALTGLALVGFVTTPARAEEHVWQTGDGFTVRATGLDLARADHRGRLLRRVEHASARLCLDYRSRGLRRACAGIVLEHAVANAPSALQLVLRQALHERSVFAVASR